MTFILILVAVVAVAAGVTAFLTKKGKFRDEDGNLIPDALEERVARVKEEVTDVTKAAKKVVKQTGDVAGAAAGKPRRGRKKATSTDTSTDTSTTKTTRSKVSNTPNKLDPDGEKNFVTKADEKAAAEAAAKVDDSKKPAPRRRKLNREA